MYYPHTHTHTHTYTRTYIHTHKHTHTHTHTHTHIYTHTHTHILLGYNDRYGIPDSIHFHGDQTKSYSAEDHQEEVGT